MEEAQGVITGGAADNIDVSPRVAGIAVVRLDEADHLKYQLIGSKLEHQRFLVEMYVRECQRAQAELATLTQEARKLSGAFGEKYNVDMQLNTVTADGVIVPLPIEQRDAIVRQLQQR
jgi:hypothetical protein